MLLGGADGGEHFCLREFLLVQNFLHGLDVQPFKTSAAQGVPGVRKVPGGVGGENGAELAGVCPAVDFDGGGLHRNQDSLVRRTEKGFRFIPDGAHGNSGKFVVYQNPVIIRHGGVRAEQAVAPQQGFRLIRRGLHGFSDDLDACGAGGIRHGSTGVEEGGAVWPPYSGLLSGTIAKALLPGASVGGLHALSMSKDWMFFRAVLPSVGCCSFHSREKLVDDAADHFFCPIGGKMVVVAVH